MPVRLERDNGELRLVGVEIEFQGQDVGMLAELMRKTLGGELERVSRAEYKLFLPGGEHYRIELDYALLKEMAGYEDDLAQYVGASGEIAFDALEAVSSLLVPCEIVAPPLPVESLSQPMNAIVEALRYAGCKGTRRSILYAFGVHLNVEPPDLQSATILSFMRAFVVLYEWILWKGKVDPSRRVTPYIDDFPSEYKLLILDSAYQPDTGQLISDYLEYNPTRNRALDMLPMFSHLDAQAVKRVVDDTLVKARPAFHYRLANSCVDEPDWSIANPWNLWVCLEALAADTDTLSVLSREYSEDLQRLTRTLDTRWRDRIQAWIDSTSV
ncbi:MAG: hypothetical protein Hals2KO_07640 [Halioglobus sp.]